jgi:hypothetical protein
VTWPALQICGVVYGGAGKHVSQSSSQNISYHQRAIMLHTMPESEDTILSLAVALSDTISRCST